ncbi:MAG: hypothetical protein AAFZ65_05165 [Planctomycetota bacterium]
MKLPRRRSSALLLVFLAACRTTSPSDHPREPIEPRGPALGDLPPEAAEPAPAPTSASAEPSSLAVGGEPLTLRWDPTASESFLAIDVVSIENPSFIEIFFQLTALGPAGEREILGAYTPFPLDNPTRFVVPEMDAVRPGTQLELRLLTTRAETFTGDVRATIGEFAPIDPDAAD